MVFSMEKINLNIAIRSFAQFINKSWATILPLIENRSYISNESSMYNWLQANWEILVERKILEINQYLDIYAQGADFNGYSSRITDPGALPNFAIRINGSSDNEVYDFLNNEKVSLNGAVFLELVSFKEGFYRIEPQFDYVLLEDNIGVERVVSINEIEFELTKIS